MSAVTVQQQAVIFLLACGLGFLLGFYYEIFRSLRLASTHTVKRCILEDVFFCVTSALTSFFMFLALTDGLLNLYVFVGEILGFLVFYGSLGRFLHVVLARVFRWLKPLFPKSGVKNIKTTKKSIFFSKKT